MNWATSWAVFPSICWGNGGPASKLSVGSTVQCFMQCHIIHSRANSPSYLPMWLWFWATGPCFRLVLFFLWSSDLRCKMPRPSQPCLRQSGGRKDPEVIATCPACCGRLVGHPLRHQVKAARWPAPATAHLQRDFVIVHQIFRRSAGH